MVTVSIGGPRGRVIALACAAIMLVGCARQEPEAADPVPPPPYGQENANVELWLETLEVGSRELYASRERVVAAMRLSPEDRVVDIGSGTGLYSLLFADELKRGVVFAVDIEPRFLTLINQRAADLDKTNIVAVLGRDDTITLPAAAASVAFIADTYFYFEDRHKVMASVREALAPEGRLFLLDYERDPPGSTRVLFGRETMRTEIEADGFTFVQEHSVEGLSEIYMLEFRRV